MARALTGPLQVARHVIAQAKAWIVFIEIPVKSPPGPASTFFRLVAGPKHLRAGGRLWQAASVKADLPAEELDGSLGSIRIELPNISRVPMAYIEAQDYLLGQPLTVYIQHEGSLATLHPALSFTQIILRATANERVMTLECGHAADIEQVPMGVYDRFAYPGLLPSGGVSLASG